MEERLAPLLLPEFHSGSLHQAQVAGHLHQVAQGLGKSGLALPAGDKIQLTEQPGHDQQHRNKKQDIPTQHRAVFCHLPVGYHRGIYGGDQIDGHTEVNVALGGVGGDTADQRVAALTVVVPGGQAHQLAPQLVAHPQVDPLVDPAAQENNQDADHGLARRDRDKLDQLGVVNGLLRTVNDIGGQRRLPYKQQGFHHGGQQHKQQHDPGNSNAVENAHVLAEALA